MRTLVCCWWKHEMQWLLWKPVAGSREELDTAWPRDLAGARGACARSSGRRVHTKPGCGVPDASPRPRAGNGPRACRQMAHNKTGPSTRRNITQSQKGGKHRHAYHVDEPLKLMLMSEARLKHTCGLIPFMGNAQNRQKSTKTESRPAVAQGGGGWGAGECHGPQGFLPRR